MTDLLLEPGRYVATEPWLGLGRYVATEPWLGLDSYVATERALGCYVATELWLELGRYVATERNVCSVAAQRSFSSSCSVTRVSSAKLFVKRSLLRKGICRRRFLRFFFFGDLDVNSS